MAAQHGGDLRLVREVEGATPQRIGRCLAGEDPGSSKPFERQESEQGECWDKIKEEEVDERGGRELIDDESGGGPVHAPCPKAVAAKPRGANTTL